MQHLELPRVCKTKNYTNNINTTNIQMILYITIICQKKLNYLIVS